MPITNGHIYIAERAAALFDEVIVSVLLNPQKKAAFTVEERKAMAREALSHLPNVKVNSFSGLLVDFLRQEQSRIIIRGLRALSDFEYEFQLALMNRQLAPEIETLFIVTEARYSYLSSHAVKEIYSWGASMNVHPGCSPSSGNASFFPEISSGEKPAFFLDPGKKTPVSCFPELQAWFQFGKA